MPFLRSRFASLLFAFSAATPTAAWADDAQPTGPAAEPSRPWVEESEAPRPPTEGAKPAPPPANGGAARPSDGGAPARPSADEGEPAKAPPGDRERARPEGRGRPSAGGRRASRVPTGEDAVGFSPGEGEQMRPSADEGEAERRTRQRFGHKGQIVADEVLGFRTGTIMGGGVGGLGGSYGFGYLTGLFMANTASFEQDGYRGRSNTVLVRPSLDVFVAEGLSVGGSVNVLYMHYKQDGPGAAVAGVAPSSQTSLNFGIEPRVGTLVRLAESLSIWPRVGVGYQGYWQGGGSGVRTDVFSAFASAGLVTELGRHAYLDVGPELRISRSRVDPNSGIIGKSSLVNMSANAALGLAF